jgi:hypothetical protein
MLKQIWSDYNSNRFESLWFDLLWQKSTLSWKLFNIPDHEPDPFRFVNSYANEFKTKYFKIFAIVL